MHLTKKSLTNSVEPNKPYHLDLQCLEKYMVWYAELKGLRPKDDALSREASLSKLFYLSEGCSFKGSISVEIVLSVERMFFQEKYLDRDCFISRKNALSRQAPLSKLFYLSKGCSFKGSNSVEIALSFERMLFQGKQLCRNCFISQKDAFSR